MLSAATAQVPDYRAIVKQFGPAVVGVTVAGTHKAEGPAQGGRGLPPGAEDDPFFQFFKGIPGLRPGRPARQAACRSSPSAARARVSSSAPTA